MLHFLCKHLKTYSKLQQVVSSVVMYASLKVLYFNQMTQMHLQVQSRCDRTSHGYLGSWPVKKLVSEQDRSCKVSDYPVGSCVVSMCPEIWPFWAEAKGSCMQ